MIVELDVVDPKLSAEVDLRALSARKLGWPVGKMVLARVGGGGSRKGADRAPPRPYAEVKLPFLRTQWSRRENLSFLRWFARTGCTKK
jgi:hypothetical protein